MGLLCNCILTWRSLALMVVLWLAVIMGTKADPAKDREECTEQLAGLATCLSYVQGEAKAPTPDCCSGLKQVLKSNKKCLCVIVRDRNDPDLGLQINATLALGLPTVCNAPANVSKCPELLHLDPKSAEAQVFYQLEKNSTGHATNATGGSPIGGPASAKSEGISSGGKGTNQDKNEGCCSGNQWLGFVLAGLMVWPFVADHQLI